MSRKLGSTSKILQRLRREAGDTLIEVTLALSILSMVLISSTVVATQAYRLGQSARERTAISVSAQGQMEAVRAFRDNNSWSDFLDGNVAAPSQPSGPVQSLSRPFKGLLNSGTSTDCHVTSPCLHMTPASANTYLPAGGTMAGPVPTSYVELVATPGPGNSPTYVDVTINYGFDGLGSGGYSGHIKTTFTNLGQAPAATPLPPAPPCNSAVTDIVLVIDTSSSMSLFPFDSGLTRLDEAKKVAKQFIASANVGPAANHIAIIGFDDKATVYSHFSGSTVALNAAVDSLVATPGTRYLAGLQAALQEFGRGNGNGNGNGNGGNARPGVKTAMLFVSDGQDGDNGYTQNQNRPAVMNAINRFPAGTDIFTVGINPGGLDMSLLQEMPRGAGFFTDASSSAKLRQAFSDIAGMIACK